MTDEFEQECRLLYEMELKDSTLRLEYEEKVRALSILREQMETEGKTKEQIALTMHERRRELGRLYKEAAPPLFREYIYYATAGKYGDPLGPTFEMLRRKKTYEQIIESASRPIEDLDSRLTLEGFRRWYLSKYSSTEQEQCGHETWQHGTLRLNQIHNSTNNRDLER